MRPIFESVLLESARQCSTLDELESYLCTFPEDALSRIIAYGWTGFAVDGSPEPLFENGERNDLFAWDAGRYLTVSDPFDGVKVEMGLREDDDD